MDYKSLCALLVTASCATNQAPEQKTAVVPTVYIPAIERDDNYERLFPKNTPELVSLQIINSIFNSGQQDHNFNFYSKPLRVVAHYGDLIEEIDEEEISLQFYIHDKKENKLIIMLDSNPYGSLDAWERCYERDRGTIYETRNVFHCERLQSSSQAKIIFEDTLYLVYARLERDDKGVDKTYKKIFYELFSSREKIVSQELRSIP